MGEPKAELPKAVVSPCPDRAFLIVRGESFQCDAMRHMAPGSETHEGCPHTSLRAEAIWTAWG